MHMCKSSQITGHKSLKVSDKTIQMVQTCLFHHVDHSDHDPLITSGAL